MPIKVGDRLPDAKFRVMTDRRPQPKTTDDIFKGKKVALFAVPGAFTPTCNNLHIPSFLNNAAAIKAKGVHTIAVTGVNDVFVMEAWKKSTGADGKIDFLADGNGEFAKAIDMAFDGSGNGLGTRSKRYSMLVDDGVVKKLNIEDAPGKCDISGGQALARAALGVSRLPRLHRTDGAGARGDQVRRARVRRRVRSWRDRHGPSPSANARCDARAPHRAAATDRRSSPASCRRCASRCFFQP